MAEILAPDRSQIIGEPVHKHYKHYPQTSDKFLYSFEINNGRRCVVDSINPFSLHSKKSRAYVPRDTNCGKCLESAGIFQVTNRCRSSTTVEICFSRLKKKEEFKLEIMAVGYVLMGLIYLSKCRKRSRGINWYLIFTSCVGEARFYFERILWIPAVRSLKYIQKFKFAPWDSENSTVRHFSFTQSYDCFIMEARSDAASIDNVQQAVKQETRNFKKSRDSFTMEYSLNSNICWIFLQLFPSTSIVYFLLRSYPSRFSSINFYASAQNFLFYLQRSFLPFKRYLKGCCPRELKKLMISSLTRN